MLIHLLPILITGAFALAIIFERTLALYWKYPLDTRRFIAEIRQRILNNDIAAAVQFCSSQEKALAASVVKAGLLRAARDNEQIENALEIVSHEAMNTAKKRLAYLSMIANVATLLGLLGTILGLIKAFAAVATVDAATKSMMLSEGISQSMNATASGLAVAIPTMIAFSILQSKANRIIESIESCAMLTMDLLSGRVYREEFDDLGNRKDQVPPGVNFSDKKAA